MTSNVAVATQNDAMQYRRQYEEEVHRMCSRVCSNVDTKVFTIVDKDLLAFMANFFETNQPSEQLLTTFKNEFQKKFPSNASNASYMAVIFKYLFASSPTVNTKCFTREQVTNIMRELHKRYGIPFVEPSPPNTDCTADELVKLIESTVEQLDKETHKPFCEKKDLIDIVQHLVTHFPEVTKKMEAQYKNIVNGSVQNGDAYVEFIQRVLLGEHTKQTTSADGLDKQLVKQLVVELLDKKQVPNKKPKLNGETIEDWQKEFIDSIKSIDDDYKAKLGQLCSHIDSYVNRYNKGIPTIAQNEALVDGLSRFSSEDTSPISDIHRNTLNMYETLGPIMYRESDKKYEVIKDQTKTTEKGELMAFRYRPY